MSDHRRRSALRLQPRRSIWLGVLLVVMHLLAAWVLLLIPLELGPRMLLMLLVALSLGYGLWAQVLALAPWSLREAIWSEQGWQLRFQNGRQREAVLLPSTLISVRLLILHFRVGWLRYPQLVLTEEVIDAELMRQLRARLRLQGACHSGR
ncbi:hypothetical protein [Halochromatium roseum]|uniref:hypothetical protein n=1 Tax=Halochromatium roseum TaxID=391920 RepID=UPI001912FC99|nr:hypothetical protein [Halochromatium roseum]MBK5938640.1 hypothetical protein [Halochromatium roseum]